jgi:hypothetical protein
LRRGETMHAKTRWSEVVTALVVFVVIVLLVLT